jgi:hydrophobic/amphiphilic exporter-1 (mainly G- bacteria), HAE1 family
VVDTFQFPNQRIEFDGRPAALLAIEKSREDDALDILATIEGFIDPERSRTPGVELALTRDIASLVEDRLLMLVKNGVQGLLLVMLVLWLFFNTRHAFWVVHGAAGFVRRGLCGDGMARLPVRHDDPGGAAGGHRHSGGRRHRGVRKHRRASRPRQERAGCFRGWNQGSPARRVRLVRHHRQHLRPAHLSSGDLGAVLKVVPAVILITLTVSFVEAFLILPAHLRHAMDAGAPAAGAAARRGGTWFALRATWWTAGSHVRALPLRRAGRLVGALLLVIAVLASGLIGFSPLPELDNESIEARLLLPQGTPFEPTGPLIDEVVAALHEIDRELTPRQPGGQPLVRHVAVRYGHNIDAYETGDHVATVTVDLLVARGPHPHVHGASKPVAGAGRAACPTCCSCASPTLRSAPRASPSSCGSPATTPNRCAPPPTTCERPGWLSRRSGPHHRPAAGQAGSAGAPAPGGGGRRRHRRALAEQLRGALFGLRAAELQVGAERFEVHVRLDEAARARLQTLDGFMVRTPNGLGAADRGRDPGTEARGWARLNRIDGRRTVTVEALVDQADHVGRRARRSGTPIPPRMAGASSGGCAVGRRRSEAVRHHLELTAPGFTWASSASFCCWRSSSAATSSLWSW